MIPVISGFLLSFAALPSLAETEVEANVGLTSNYLWRGVSRTNDGPAISGGLNLKSDSGLYTGVWASSINYDDSDELEFNLYAGYEGVASVLDYSVGLIRYNYPMAESGITDQTELFLNLGYSQFSTGVAFTVDGETGSDTPFNSGEVFGWVGYTFPLSESVELDLISGYYLYDENRIEYEDSDYGYVQLDLSFHRFMLSMSRAASQSGDDDSRVVLSWNHSFSF